MVLSIFSANLLSICMSSLGKSLFRWSANIFSYSVGGLLTLWVLSFAVYNFSVMHAPLSDSAVVACPYVVISMKLSLDLVSWGFSLIFLLSIIVSCTMFKPKLTFVHGLMRVDFHSFACEYPAFPTATILDWY